MKSSEILRAAAKRIRYRKDDYLCHALLHVGRTFSIEHLKISELKDEISSRLDSNSALEYWLFAQGIPYQDLTGGRVLKHRVAWALQMADEYAKGN